MFTIDSCYRICNYYDITEKYSVVAPEQHRVELNHDRHVIP